MCSGLSEVLLFAVNQEPGSRIQDPGFGIQEAEAVALTQCNLLAARLSCRRLGLNLVPLPGPLVLLQRERRLGVSSSRLHAVQSRPCPPVHHNSQGYNSLVSPKNATMRRMQKCLCLGMH